MTRATTAASVALMAAVSAETAPQPATAGIPLPTITQVAAPFWEACRRGVLQVLHCNACGFRTHPPDVVCNSCLSAHVAWMPCAGLGTVVSCSIVWRPSQPSFPVPYVAAIVRLDEG